MNEYVIRCKSHISGRISVLHNNDKIQIFYDKEEAETKAKEMRDLMGINYHYWVDNMN